MQCVCLSHLLPMSGDNNHRLNEGQEISCFLLLGWHFQGLCRSPYPFWVYFCTRYWDPVTLPSPAREVASTVYCKQLPLTYAAPLEWELHTKTLLFVYSRLFSELLGPETGELPGSQPFGRGFCVYSRSTLPFSEVQSHSHEAAKSSGKQQQLFPTLPLGGRYFLYFQGSTNHSASPAAKAPWASGWAEC